MTLLRTSALNAAAVAVRIVTALGVNKVLALYLGPVGYTLVAQLGNLASLLGAVASGAMSSGVTKYTAEYAGSEDRQKAVWRAAAYYLIVTTAAAWFATVTLSEPLARLLFGTSQYSPFLVALGFALPLMSLNAHLLSILNGKKEVRLYVVQGMLSTLLSAITTAAFSAMWGLRGALAAMLLNHALACGLTLLLCRGRQWMSRRSLLGPLDRSALAPLMGYAAMALVSAIAAPLGQLIVRDHLIGQFGAGVAGEWQAVFKVSEIYIQLFTATLTLYYLPRLAEIQRGDDLWREIAKVCGFVLPFAMLAACVIYLSRNWIVHALFSAEFNGMVRLFGWQLLGDVLKVGSWVFGFVLVGRAMVRWFVLLEVIFGLSWIGLTVMLTAQYGIVGAPMAFAANYLAYWFTTVALVWRESKRMAT